MKSLDIASVPLLSCAAPAAHPIRLPAATVRGGRWSPRTGFVMLQFPRRAAARTAEARCGVLPNSAGSRGSAHCRSSKFLDYYLALFYWAEKNKDKTYLEQAYDIITLFTNQTEKIPLAKFKYKPIPFDMKSLAI